MKRLQVAQRYQVDSQVNCHLIPTDCIGYLAHSFFFSINLIKMEGNVVLCHIEIVHLLNVLLCQNYLWHSKTFSLKNNDAFPKLLILETCNYSPKAETHCRFGY